MTNSLPKPDVIITHESDLDGLVAGVLLQRLARKLFNTEIRLEAYHYNNWRQRDLRRARRWVADLTFESRMDRPNWVIIDHHATEIPAKSAFFIHDVTKSAGLLAYDLCRELGLASPALDRLVHLNNVSDLFLEDDPEFDLAGDYANLVKIYQFWNLHTLFAGEIERVLDHPLLEVMAVKRRIEDPIGLAWSSGECLGNQSVGGLCGHGHWQQQPYRSPTVGAAGDSVFGVGDFVSAGQWSDHRQFAEPEREALKIAAKLQGGGHPNACGATLPRSVKTVPDAVAYLRQILNPPVGAPRGSLEELFDVK